MSNNPISGIIYFFNGFSLIAQPGIRKWVVIPLLINILLFSGLIYYAVLYFPMVSEMFMAQVESTLPDWGGLVMVISLLMWPLFIILALVVVFFTFTLVANLIAGPFTGPLANAVYEHLTGKSPESASESLSGSLIGVIKDPIEKLWYYFKWAMVFLIISLIPLINIVSPVLWFLFGAWIVVLEYAEVPLANHGYKTPVQRKILAQKRLLSLGFGSAVFVTMLIPLLNFFVLPAAVAGATAMWVNQLEKSAPPISST